MIGDRCEVYQQFKAIGGVYRAGDVVALRKARGDLPYFRSGSMATKFLWTRSSAIETVPSRMHNRERVYVHGLRMSIEAVCPGWVMNRPSAPYHA